MVEEHEPPIYPTDGSLTDDINGLRHRSNGVNQDTNPQSSEDVVMSLSQPRNHNLRVHLYDEQKQTYLTRDEEAVVTALFSAIEQGQDDMINALISNNLVDIGTLDVIGRTPLVAAVESAHIVIVQQLMDFGADVNAWSFYNNSDDASHIYRKQDQTRSSYVIRADFNVRRTPLMVAARNGNITLVKLLRDVYHADDSLIATDGQTALRLAATNGHREIVNILPPIRGGGLQRWQYKNRKAFRRIEKYTLQVYWVFKGVLYDIPRCLLWSIPKHLIVLPARDCVKWLHKNRNQLVSKFVNFTKRCAKRTWQGLKKLPKAARESIKYCGDLVVKLVKWIYKAIFVKLPIALSDLYNWSINALKKVTDVIIEFLLSIVSAFHSLIVRILHIMENLTWADVGRGFLEVVRWVFVKLPQQAYLGTVNLINALKELLVKAFGEFGHLIVFLLKVLVRCIAYIPKRLWRILSQFGNVLKRAGHELRVYHNPKYV